MAYVIKRTDTGKYVQRDGGRWDRPQYTERNYNGRKYAEIERAEKAVAQIEDRFPSTKGKFQVETIEYVTHYTVSRLYDREENDETDQYELDIHTSAEGSSYIKALTPAEAFRNERQEITAEIDRLQKALTEQYAILAKVDGFLANPEARQELVLAETDRKAARASGVNYQQNNEAHRVRVVAANVL